MNEGFETKGRFKIRFMAGEDAGEVRELFRRVFKHDMSDELWQWKYAKGWGQAALVYDDNGLVAHYGGITRGIMMQGKPMKALQIVDVMVDSSVRNAVRKQSPFYLGAKKFLQRFIGFEKEFLLGYGFPSDRAMGLAQRLGLYAPVGEVVELKWPAKKSLRVQAFYRLEKVAPDNFDSLKTELEKIWRGFSRQLQGAIVGIKNAAHIKRRFLDYPDKDYQIYLVRKRFGKQILGMFVLRDQQENGVNRSLLLEMMGKFEDFPALIRAARHLSAKQGQDTLATWVSKSYASLFSCQGATELPLRVYIPTCVCTWGPEPEELRDKWWLMAGDTDFL